MKRQQALVSAPGLNHRDNIQIYSYRHTSGCTQSYEGLHLRGTDKESTAMATINQDMRDIVGRAMLSFVATVCADG